MRDRRDGFLEADLSRLWISVGERRARQQRRKPNASRQNARAKGCNASGGCLANLIGRLSGRGQYGAF